MCEKRVLIVGGTGYLGQHLLQSFTEIQQRSPYTLAFTHHTNPPPQQLISAIPHALPFQVDLRTGDGLHAVTQTLGQPDVVVNCAALSVPRACEMDPAAAMSINIPTALIKWLSSFSGKNTLLIHLSTDQVYEGTKPFYKEEDETVPVNVYGKSKVAAEQFVYANCSNFAILRSSIIYGPQTISPVPKSLPIQWMDSVLSKGEPLNFFHDEFRCPVYVKDLVTVIRTLTDRWISVWVGYESFTYPEKGGIYVIMMRPYSNSAGKSSVVMGFVFKGKQMQLLLNVGGPDRVSRVQMAEAVVHARNYNMSLITPVSAASVDRGVKSPADISMDITKLIQTLHISPISYSKGVRLTLDAESSS